MPGEQARDALVVADACTLQNFAVVDGLELLRLRFGDRIGWTEAVAYEVSRGVRAEPLLNRVIGATWLGSPLRLDQDGDDEVELIRRGLGGLDAEPLKHLGEAESIRALERISASTRILLTDDRPCADFARRRSSGIRVLDCAQILAECHAMGEIGCPEAYQLLQAMEQYPRPVRVPPHREVC